MTPALDVGLALVLLLFAQEIGDEAPMPPPEPPAPVAEAPAPSPAPPAPAPKAPRAPRQGMPTASGVTIDARAFQAAFRRQAAAELLPCLAAWRPAPNGIGVVATLSRTGKLANAAALNPGDALPGCATAAMAKMDFKPLAQRLGAHTVTLQWRVDW